MNLETYHYPHPFLLESGQHLPHLEIAYHTFGTLNKDQSNVIWVCHALTANSNVTDWWQGLFGEGCMYDPATHFIICANNPGSCYGSTGPLSVNPVTKEPWYSYFPQLSIRDLVAGFELLRTHLAIEKINTLIGGSQGGQIALEWAITNPTCFKKLIVVATNAYHSPWGVAFNEAQRLAIKADRTYYSNLPDGGSKGLSAARSIALLSYRTYNTYNATQHETDHSKTKDHKAACYQRYQGEKLVKRFNAYSCVTLLNAMDSHNIARNRTATIEQALQKIKANTLVIGISTDILFPVDEQKFIASHIPNAGYMQVDSAHGHDGFLIETEKLAEVIKRYYSHKRQQETGREAAIH